MDSPYSTRLLAITYAATIFTSAFLLFQIQPLITKHILPWFGGGSAVWTTCLLFFQTVLFAGYAYAHFIHARLRPRQQAVVHASLIVVAIAALLGLLPDSRWEPGGGEDPVAGILIILAVSVGLPYFVLSATGPLLQAWFARSFPGTSPYRLYALSNVGSLLALVSYPFIFEPLLSLPRQGQLWSLGFVMYAALCGYAAWRLWSRSHVDSIEDPARRTRGPKSRRAARSARLSSPKSVEPKKPAVNKKPRWTQPVLWLVWPAFASIVLMATTNHVSTDIAAMPFLWIAPLALYLLTFIIAFDRPAWYRRTPIAVLILAATYGTAMVHRLGVGSADLFDVGTPGLFLSIFAGPFAESPEFQITTPQFLVINFVAMFAICMLCHGELVRARPDPSHLTSFYLMIAAGGALGGAFVTLVAPQAFTTYFEWQLSLFVACLIAIGYVLRMFIDIVFADDKEAARPSRYALLAGLVLAIFLPSAVMLLDLTEFLQGPTAESEFRTRNFYGTLSVYPVGEKHSLTHHNALKHGVINHGAQFTHESRRKEPITYYPRNSGVARTIDYYRRQLESSRMKLGVVGLGTGTLAAYVDGGDAITFYEINQAVIDIAESGRWFTYLRDCRARGGDCDIKLGDARLTLRRELEQRKPQQFHVLVLDAFSGDSIPVHLLTVEAFELYLAHLSTPSQSASAGGHNQHGAIAVHVSNRYLDLPPLIYGIAKRFDLSAIQINNDYMKKNAINSAKWIILTRNERLADELVHFANAPAPSTSPFIWTDTYSSLFNVLK